MNKLLQLHDKVKFHRYRDDIVLNAPYYKRYVRAFSDLLDAFQQEINAAKAVPAPDRDRRQKMLVELENRCFLIDARHKLSLLSLLAEAYCDTGDYSTQQQIQVLMAQLESTLSSIHEYISYGRVGFILRYPSDDSLQVLRLVWKGTDYSST